MLNPDTNTPKAPFLVLILTCLAGLVFSFYALNHHYTVKDQGQTDAACNINSTLNCDAVASSAYSEFAGIPLGGFGIAFFLSALFLAFAAYTKINVRPLVLGLGKNTHPSTYSNGLVLLGIIGVVVSLILGIISHTKVGSLCPTCLLIYISTFVLMACAFLLDRPFRPYGYPRAVNGAAYAAIPTLLVLGIVFAHGKARTPKGSEVTDDVSSADPHDHAPTNPGAKVDIPIATSPYHATGEDYRKGSDSAKVTLVEFADFECPACQSLAAVLGQIHKEFGDAVRIVFKNFPLNKECNPAVQMAGHAHACRVAVLARCAGQYGKFWQYHDLAFAKQRQLANGIPSIWAKEVGLTDEQINTCLASKDHLAKIAADGKLGDEVQVDATPTLYINGQKYMGPRNKEAISSAILRLL